MVCDGLPFILCSKLIDQNQQRNGKILLLPGLGHEEMNLTKGIFKLQAFVQCLPERFSCNVGVANS